ncbi:unnamed protein product [Ambrosiozyma monospora]|uniref:Unnamed protein product n=1 Tax=Ambrosiozyma monospora TaxID=43982 RepID=A0A9W6Z4V6_AMBMO|nr:unnamed protein product [Ambrosiozyma monospora]
MNTNNYETSGGNSAFHNFVNDFADISDPLERRAKALAEIDNAKFSWYHVRSIMVAGVGFMTDAYDLFTINIAISMITNYYYNDYPMDSTKTRRIMPASTETLLKVSTPIGTVIGEVVFGIMADLFGRKYMYGIELMIMIGATILQCTAGESGAINFAAVFAFYRIIMGIGIGGDYPLSSIISAEFATTRWRGAIMAAVFANQGWGQLLAGIVALIIIVSYKGKTNASDGSCDLACALANDKMWRILIGFGAVPGCLALYFRLTIPESPRFTFDVSKELEKATADALKYISGDHGEADIGDIEYLQNTQGLERILSLEVPPLVQRPDSKFADFVQHFSQWKHLKYLIGTAGSWFMLDVAYYGLGLNLPNILHTIGFEVTSSSKDDSISVYKELYNEAAGNLLLICAGSIPGYWTAVATLDWLGRKPIQIMGFFLTTGLLCIIGFCFNKIGQHGKVALYILCQYFLNFGPNTTTFIVPGECFPTRFRSTTHGISAAAGKIGAVIAQTCIGTLENHNCPIDPVTGKGDRCWLNNVMKIFALFMLLGFFFSFLIPETKRKTLEQLNEELHGEVDISRNHISYKDI